jgi:hypothetical protein
MLQVFISFVCFILQELAAVKAEAEEASQHDEEYGIKPEVAITEESVRKESTFMEDEFVDENYEEEEFDD